MGAWSLRITPAAAAWIAMTVVASAGPLTSEADAPTGDVWITPDVPRPSLPLATQNTPVRQLPTGDFWPADDSAIRTADTPAPARGAMAREGVAGGVK